LWIIVYLLTHEIPPRKAGARDGSRATDIGTIMNVDGSDTHEIMHTVSSPWE
jgi:hypothetical protein